MDDRRLRILFLCSWYPNRVIPALGNFVQKHAEAVALRCDVAVLHVCSDENCKEKFEVVEDYQNGVYSVNVYYKKVNRKTPILAYSQKLRRYAIAHLIGLKNIEKRYGSFDLIHLNILYPAGLIARLLRKRLGIPYIITENWTVYLPSKKVKLSRSELKNSKKIARDADCITPVSLDLQNAMEALGFDNEYEIVYNVVNMKLFHPPIRKERGGKIKFLHVSTLDDAHKNISGMLRVFARLAAIRQDFEITFVGEGDKEAYIQLAKELGIYVEHVTFIGTQNTAGVSEIMRKADCFVMFSNYENLPCVMVEAMATGLPVVLSTAGGVPEHVTPDRGILVEPKDENKLLEALQEVMLNIEHRKYNATLIANYALQNFSYEKVGLKFEMIYRSILESYN